MIQVLITLRENTVPSVGKESLNTASIVQPIPLIFATRMNLMRDVVKTSASWAALPQIGNSDYRFTAQTSRSVSLIELLWIPDFWTLTAIYVKISHKSELRLRFWDFNSKICVLWKGIVMTILHSTTVAFSGICSIMEQVLLLPQIHNFIVCKHSLTPVTDTCSGGWCRNGAESKMALRVMMERHAQLEKEINDLYPISQWIKIDSRVDEWTIRISNSSLLIWNEVIKIPSSPLVCFLICAGLADLIYVIRNIQHI